MKNLNRALVLALALLALASSLSAQLSFKLPERIQRQSLLIKGTLRSDLSKQEYMLQGKFKYLVEVDNSTTLALLSATLVDSNNKDPQSGELFTRFEHGVSDAYMINAASCIHNPGFGAGVACDEWRILRTSPTVIHFHQNCHFASDPHVGGLSQELYLNPTSNSIIKIMGNVTAGKDTLYTFDISTVASEIDGPHDSDFVLPENCHVATKKRAKLYESI